MKNKDKGSNLTTGMSRRDFIRLAGMGAGAMTLPALFSCGGNSGASGKQPNILFIMTDDHATHALSCYGSTMIETPNLDRIANEGVIFNNCFCTNSLCSPSRASLLTGKYSHEHGVKLNFSSYKPDAQTTFPEILQQTGYQTALIGKTHLTDGKFQVVDLPGFDYYNILTFAGGQGTYNDPLMIEKGADQPTVHPGYVTDIITDQAIDYLENRDGDKPFCLLVHHKAPHANFKPDDAHRDLFKDETIPVPDTFDDDYDGFPTRTAAAAAATMRILDHLDEGARGGDLEEEQPEFETDDERKNWKYQTWIKNYLRVVVSVDNNTGRLLDYLDKNNLTQNTIVIYTTDNGFFLGDHGWFDKRFMYEQSLRLPLMVRYPEEIEAGNDTDRIALNVDFAPTFLDYAGIPIPDDMHGESIRPLLKGNVPSDWRTSMYYHYYDDDKTPLASHAVCRHYGIRTDRYKLIYFYNIDTFIEEYMASPLISQEDKNFVTDIFGSVSIGEDDKWELYDLQQDPDELNNIYKANKESQTVENLKAELEQLRTQYDVPADNS